ncbi:uncharacterized protein zgc:194655 [Lampris incognitus]|uniref:uncharacterized protein zgc:194655 n=1 Tax=Lampris incognitus TaxID=2546036 RepID=UPI0024B5F0FB|nr:uncharacterized protein zgc:194655 [Lampris incognitus]
MGKIYQVIVNGVRGEKMTIDLCNTDEQMNSFTVEQLKHKIVEKIPGDSMESLRLIFTDKLLDEDSATLASYGVQHQSVLQLVLRVPGGLRV